MKLLHRRWTRKDFTDYDGAGEVGEKWILPESRKTQEQARYGWVRGRWLRFLVYSGFLVPMRRRFMETLFTLVHWFTSMKAAKDIISIFSIPHVTFQMHWFNLNKNGGYIPILFRSPALATDQTHSAAEPGSLFSMLHFLIRDQQENAVYRWNSEGGMLVMGLPLSCQTTNSPFVKVNNALCGAHVDQGKVQRC